MYAVVIYLLYFYMLSFATLLCVDVIPFYRSIIFVSRYGMPS